MGNNKLSNISICSSCEYLNYARLSYYKFHKRVRKQRKTNQKVVEEVLKIKAVQPKIGGKKIHHLLRQILLESGQKELGRDKLFDLLRERNLLVKRKKYTARTTNSNHRYKKYPNLIKGKEINAVNEVWVSDITYLRVNDSFCYLSLVTDVKSRKIVGYYVNNTLEREGSIKAVKRALKHGVPKIHHSDRGIQYCSEEYTDLMHKKEIKISMTQDGNCYDNALLRE